MSRSRFPPHTELWEAYQADRSLENRNRLVEAYYPLVEWNALAVVRRMSRRVRVEELIGYGSEGLMRAVERFDPSRGLQFNTFATHLVRFAIISGLRDDDWLPRLERRRANQGTVTPVEMIPMSVCLAIDEDDQFIPLSLATYDQQSTADEWAALLRGLGKRERLLMLMHYREELTFREIGKHFGLSYSRVGQIHKSILERLQQSAENPRCCS